MTLPVLEIFTKEYLKQYFSRNKRLILISAILLIISAVLGVIFHEVIEAYFMDLLKQMIGKIPENPTVRDEATFLFQNNVTANFIILLGGIFFSVFSVLAVILNGMVIGFTYTLVNPIQFVVGIVPHGIFELPALILSLVGAFNITKLEINLLDALFKHRLKDEIANSKTIVLDIILTVVIVVILLIIAALIEAGITPILLSMVL